MKTLIILSCFSGWQVLLAFLFGVFVMIVAGFIVRAREQKKMREQRDVQKLAIAIQRYYWLIKRGKSVEANQKALKKFISVFSNRILSSSPAVVEYALKSFKNKSFSPLIDRIDRIYILYKSQFIPRPSPSFDGMPVENVVAYDHIITTEDAVNQIEKVFEEAKVKGFQNFY